MTDISELNGVDDAMKVLDALEAERGPAAADPADSANPEQRAAQPEASDAEAQLNTLTDTPAAADPAATPEPTTATQKPDATDETQAKPVTRDEKGKFAREKQRRDDSWKALNAEKAAWAEEQARFKAEREAWQREREAAAQENQVTPERYEAYGQQMQAQADHLLAEADRLEAAGKFDEAEAKREDARDAVADVRKAKKAAADLRANPPASLQQRNEQVQAQKREWTLKAAQDFPDLAKDGSEFQKAVANNLAELASQAPTMARDPRSIYFVTKLVAAETAAAGVPELKKKLSQTEARVKELEALTGPTPPGNPGPAGGEIPFEQRSREEQFAELERLATGMPLR